MTLASIVTIVAAPAVTALVELSRVKLELDITSNDRDAILLAKITEASSDIEAALNFTVARSSVTETFWHRDLYDCPEMLILDRTPVAAIASVIIDGATIDPGRYRLDADPGLLYALDECGYPSVWIIEKSAIVTYDGGFLLPGQDGRDLPAGIEGAALSLVQAFWSAKGRDPMIKAEETAGIGRTEYWVGAVGDPDELPPDVLRKLAPYRRAAA